MRTSMTLFATGLMFLTSTTAFGIGNTMMSLGHAYTTPGPRVVVRYAPAFRAAAPVQATEGRRSLSVEPGTTAAPVAVAAPTYRVVRPHTPTWLLPKTDAHRYTTW